MNTKIKRLLSLLFVSEHNCIVCDRELLKPTPYLTCDHCYQAMEIIEEGVCLKCGKKLFGEEEYCLDCKSFEKHFDRAFAAACYADAAANLVMNLKFHNRRYLAAPLARYMIDRLLREEISADVCIPVPLHEKREKERGYNQSVLLAEEIARGVGIPLDVTNAIRVKETLPSTSLAGGRKAREENISGAFVLKDKSAVKNKVVLVVDDVLTTGATTSELARVLKKAGAKSVYVLTFATTKEKPPIQRGN